MRIALILTLLTLTGCSKTWSDKDLVFVSVLEAKSLFTEDGGSWIKEGKPNVWVDTRNPSRYTIGHIPGAINIPLRSVDAQWRRVETYGTIIVYGHTWNDPIAVGESKALLEKGVENVKTLNGGWQAWTEAGGASEPGSDSELVEDENLDRTKMIEQGASRKPPSSTTELLDTLSDVHQTLWPDRSPNR